MPKYIFVTGGVLSGLGKGTVAASIAKILQFRGFSVSMVKCDPYLNVDAGTMNPLEHGENFVCEEVWEFSPVPDIVFRIAEVDQDFGTYERFTGENIHPSHNITSGQIYLTIILKERYGEFLGKTVQIIPHVTDEIKRRILLTVDEKKDVIIVEIGGTVGDIEGMPFLEAIRQLRHELPPNDTLLVHVTYVPFLRTIGQQKTKPTQHSVQRLLQAGLQPDIIVARSETPLSKEARSKIALFAGLRENAVISAPDCEVVYELPLIFENQGMGNLILQKLNLTPKTPPERNIVEWRSIVEKFKHSELLVNIAMVGKYTHIKDSYISIVEALKHAGAHENVKVNPVFIDAEKISENELKTFDGILLTPGFGRRATEGMILAARIALRTGMPFLGICFGAQLGTVAFAREIMKWEKANSTEIDPSTPHPVVDLLPSQKEVKVKGGTMRLGGIKIKLVRGTKLWQAYGQDWIVERFRHRYHIIWEYAKIMREKGFIINAIDTENNIAGFEVEWHPFFIGVQFHPEFKSRPFAPSPTYRAFIRAVKEKKKNEHLKNKN
ncbi:MAG: CTP synthase [Candidatus Njordarchaeales archaeon]